MRIAATLATITMALGVATTFGWAAAGKAPGKAAAPAKLEATTKSAAPGKPAPGCAALAFRPLASGGSEGEQTAGSYKSRLARLELKATVQNSEPVNYYLVANGARLGAAKKLADGVENCAAAKKMPKPQAAAGSCIGDGFTLVVAHAGNDRVGLLYGHDGGAWKFCGAGSF